MSQEFDEHNMISATLQCDAHLGETIGEKDFSSATLMCAFENHKNRTDYAFASGSVLLICDGTTKQKTVMRRFEMEFDIKKVLFHAFCVSRNAADEESTESGVRRNRDFLVVCGEHRMLFLSMPDYHFYHYEIPFKLRNVFSCSTSIIIERFYDSSTEQNFQNHDTFHLYSLSGPFGELLPVIYKTDGLHPQWKFCWQSHRDDAEMIDTDGAFVVVYDQKEKVHRVYMARETEEQEVHAAIRHVETMRRHHDSTVFLAPHSAPRHSFEPTQRSPAQIALSEVINSGIEGRSPLTTLIRSGFGHSTPNNQNTAGFQGTLPTPIFEGNNDSHIWASTPNTRANVRGGLERNIHTRTLARMVNDEPTSSPTPSYGRIQTTSSPYRPHLTLRHGDSNAELLRDFTRMIRDTPRGNGQRRRRAAAATTTTAEKNVAEDVDFGDLERDPDVDLLLSKVCLECVYVEPKGKAIPRANKIFVSNFLSETHLNLVSTTGEILKMIPICKSAEKTRRMLAEGGKNEPFTIECVDAAFVKKCGLTVVLSPEFVTTVYGGSERIAPIFIPEISNKRQSRNFRLFQFAANQLAAVNEMRCIIVSLPETVVCEAATTLMRTFFASLPRHFSRQVLRAWRAVKRDHDSDALSLERVELVDVVTFFLEKAGVRVGEHDERPESPEGHGGKQMRPRMSDAEVQTVMEHYFEQLIVDAEVEDRNWMRRKFSVELDPSGSGFEHARDVFNALHAQCEEWSLYPTLHPMLIRIVPYVFVLAKTLQYHDYAQYYTLLFPTVIDQTTVDFRIANELGDRLQTVCQPAGQVWNVYDVLSVIIYEKNDIATIGGQLPRAMTRRCVQLLMIVAAGRGMIGAGFELECGLWIGQGWARRLGLSSAALRAFKTVMKDALLKPAGKANNLIRIFKLKTEEIDRLTVGLKVLLIKFQTDAFAETQTIEPKKCVYATPEEMTSIAQLRWKHDIRKRNVEMMLNSSRPVLIAANILRKNEDDNMKELQDRFLTQTSFRTFCQSFGRAYYEFRSAVPSLLTCLQIPRLAIGGMVYPARVTCDAPSTEHFKNCTEWGSFYNCCAAALRIGSSDMVRIDNEWIVMVSKTVKVPQMVGGIFLGFGLNGHLASFNMFHAHQMLASFDKFHSVALLIGLTASNFTTCDLQIYKILATYLSFLMGPTPLEIRLDFTIQTAAISGLGLLFADSGNMNIAKKLVNEIGKAPNRDEEPIVDRAAYKLSAGFSLGLIMLGKGNGAASSVVPFKQNIPPLSTRLIYMMNGMRRDKCVFLPQSIAPVVSEVTNLPFSTGGLMTSSQVANHVKDNENINIHQSAEPAAIALGLMFMKTHNEFIAASLALPTTITDLERLKPDSMYSRVLGYCLVMWDRIEPTHDFVKSLIPKVIREYAAAALHFGIPIRRNENGEVIKDEMTEAEERYCAEQIDRATVAQTFLYTVSAACMAIALKYSSCGGPEEKNIVNKAFRVIEFYTKIVLPDGKSDKRTGSHQMCSQAGAYTRSSCLSMLITAMAILRVGTGDLEVMRYARLLRLCDKPDTDWISMGKKHFEQMIAHQALGILLIGEGRYAFKKDDLSVALTVIATFPTIPQGVADNSRYHQPLRFLWTLAVEPRLLVPFDCAENCVVEVDVTIVMKPTAPDSAPVTYKQRAPFLLPPLESLQSISVGGGKYEVVHINLQTEEELRVLRDVMSVGQGRVMLKKYTVSTLEMRVNEATAMYDAPLDLMSLLTSEHTALRLDEHEIAASIAAIEDAVQLNSSDEYPSVQVQLSSVRDVTDRTSIDLAAMHKKALNLLGDSLDLWPDEVNVSNAIRELAALIDPPGL